MFAQKAQQAGLGFVVIGEREFPEGAMGEATAQLGRLNGLKAVRFTVELLRTNDQPGIASRLEWLGVAEVVAPSRLSVQRLGAAIQRVLREPVYREKARRYQQEIAHLNGLALAADIVDQAISARGPVLRNRPLARLRP